MNNFRWVFVKVCHCFNFVNIKFVILVTFSLIIIIIIIFLSYYFSLKENLLSQSEECYHFFFPWTNKYRKPFSPSFNKKGKLKVSSKVFMPCTHTVKKIYRRIVFQVLITLLINNSMQHIDWLLTYIWEVWLDETFDKYSQTQLSR